MARPNENLVDVGALEEQSERVFVPGYGCASIKDRWVQALISGEEDFVVPPALSTDTIDYLDLSDGRSAEEALRERFGLPAQESIAGQGEA